MEVVVFTAILSLFFVAAATITTYMIRTQKVNEHKIIGTRYAEDLLEWMKAERDIDWNAFTARADTGGTTYCMNDDPPVWAAAAGCGYDIDSVFKRTVKLTSSVASGYIYQVNVEIIVEWKEGSKIYTVPLNSTFAVLEQ